MNTLCPIGLSGWGMTHLLKFVKEQLKESAPFGVNDRVYRSFASQNMKKKAAQIKEVTAWSGFRGL